MSEFEIPEDLTGLTNDELDALKADLVSEIRSLRNSEGKPTEETLAQARLLVGHVKRIDAELAVKAAEAETLAEMDEILDAFEDTDSDEEPEVAEAAEELSDDAEQTEDDSDETELEDAEGEELETEITEEAAADEDATEELSDEIEETEEVEEIVEELNSETDESEDVVEDASDELEVDDADDAEVVDEASDELATEEDAAEEAEEVIEEDATASDETEPTNEEITQETEMSDKPEGALEAPTFLIPRPRGSETKVLAAAGAPSVATGVEIENMGELAGQVLEAWQKMGGHSGWNLPQGTYENVAVATVKAASDEETLFVGRDPEENYSVFDAAVKASEAERSSDEALVAGGGFCAPLNTDYNFFRLAVPMNPVERALPRVRAPRGGIRFLQPPAYTDPADGIAITTSAGDAAGYVSTPAECDGPGPTADKPCVCVACPGTTEVRSSAVSACVRWGNFQYYTFPELVQAFMSDLAVNYSKVKETLYLDAIDAGSTNITATDPVYGAIRGITWALRLAGIRYRKSNHMPKNAVLELFVPDWLVDALKVDMINDNSLGLNQLNISDAQVDAILRSLGFRTTYYYDGPTGVDTMQTAQAAAALGEFPNTARAYIFAPGTFVRIDSGSLDLGIVRDSVLNRTNDLTMFMEEFTNVAKVGLESYKMTLTVTPSGAAAGTTPLVVNAAAADVDTVFADMETA